MRKYLIMADDTWHIRVKILTIPNTMRMPCQNHRMAKAYHSTVSQYVNICLKHAANTSAALFKQIFLYWFMIWVYNEEWLLPYHWSCSYWGCIWHSYSPVLHPTWHNAHSCMWQPGAKLYTFNIGKLAIQTFGNTSHIGLTVELSPLSSTGSLKVI